VPENPDASPGRPTVFISYSHRDEGWKDRLETALKALGIHLGVWSDRRIDAGDGWETEIVSAMDCAEVAILLISNDFLASRFIQEKEIPHLRKRWEEGTLRILPLLVRPSTWEEVDWLVAIQGRPTDAKPLSTLRKAQADQHLSAFAKEVRSHLTASTASPSPGAGREGDGRGGQGVRSNPASTSAVSPSPDLF
jgi:TIR domain